MSPPNTLSFLSSDGWKYVWVVLPVRYEPAVWIEYIPCDDFKCVAGCDLWFDLEGYNAAPKGLCACGAPLLPRDSCE